jgi:hypothetical protein
MQQYGFTAYFENEVLCKRSYTKYDALIIATALDADSTRLYREVGHRPDIGASFSVGVSAALGVWSANVVDSPPQEERP